jgi:hypothetical protein
MFLTTEAVIVEEKEEKCNPPREWAEACSLLTGDRSRNIYGAGSKNRLFLFRRLQMLNPGNDLGFPDNPGYPYLKMYIGCMKFRCSFLYICS